MISNSVSKILNFHQQVILEALEKVNIETKQEEFQTGVLNRLDTQEALTEKISRQLNHIRSIIFERTDYIATKLEDSYKKTSAYVYKLMNGTEHPTYSTLVNSKKKKNQQNTD